MTRFRLTTPVGGLVQIIGDDGAANYAIEAAIFEKRTERPEDLGLSITDGKPLVAAVRQRVVNAQITSWRTDRSRPSPSRPARGTTAG
jgi:hypothetical protein